MRFIIITILALLAFAANSVLTRYALALEQIGPADFMVIRLIAGAVMLAGLVLLNRIRFAGSVISSLALLVYVVGFSFAYVSLETGTGALILFGGVQITMFVGAIFVGETPPIKRWIAAIVSSIGLAVLFLPGAAPPDVFGAGLMALAAIGWGVYSLRGRSVSAPLADTAGNFLMAAPLALLIWLVLPGDAVQASASGILLAIASGAVASGVGYALWYAALPALDAAMAAILQLTVPLIALGGGMLFLSEPLTWNFVIAATLILGSVAASLLKLGR